jgi:hypothetical protein
VGRDLGVLEIIGLDTSGGIDSIGKLAVLVAASEGSRSLQAEWYQDASPIAPATAAT